MVLKIVVFSLLMYIILKLVTSLFRQGRPHSSSDSRERPSTHAKRFDARDKNVADAEFEDIADKK